MGMYSRPCLRPWTTGKRVRLPMPPSSRRSACCGRMRGMNIEQWTAVEEYIGRNLVKEDKALAQALADSKAAGLPGIQVTPNLGKLLMLMAKMVGAKKIL